MKIEQNNKLIAKFMGYKTRCPYPEVALYLTPYGHTKLKFHSSWDWLMPVAKKCYKKAEDMEAKEWCRSIQDCMTVFSMEHLYNELVRFIQWHNNN